MLLGLGGAWLFGLRRGGVLGALLRLGGGDGGGLLLLGDGGAVDEVLLLLLFGSGGGISTPGCRSFSICHSHNAVSSAMLIQRLVFPSLFSTCLISISFVTLFRTCLGSVISAGSSRWRLLTIDFLFVISGPPIGLGWLHHAVRSCLGGCWSGALTTLPRKDVWRIAIWFLMSGMLWKVFRMLEFLMCSSWT